MEACKHDKHMRKNAKPIYGMAIARNRREATFKIQRALSMDLDTWSNRMANNTQHHAKHGNEDQKRFSGKFPKASSCSSQVHTSKNKCSPKLTNHTPLESSSNVHHESMIN